MPFHVKHSGAWKVPEISVKHSGSWKPAEYWVKQSGTWKLVQPIAEAEVTPTSKTATQNSSSHTFAGNIVGTVSRSGASVSWDFVDTSGGTWSIATGQNTATVTIRVTGVSTFVPALATLRFKAVFGSNTYIASIPVSYSNEAPF